RIPKQTGRGSAARGAVDRRRGGGRMIRMLVLPFLAFAVLAASGFEDEIAQWRKQREERLKAEGGWLSLAGLSWLHEGANPFGTDAANEVVIPDGTAKAGVFELKGGKVVARMNGTDRELWPDSLDFVQAGRVKMYVIKRGDRVGI